MAEYGISRAFMFCLDEPDRHPAFSAANDRTLAFAERSNGRLIPFVRLDLNESPIEEATRCLDAGARGIKLHPRAQRFDSTDDRLGPVFALAEERRVPILIHGGRGLPPIADGLATLVEREPRRDADHRPRRASPTWRTSPRRWPGRKGVFFDTSTWSAIDLLDLYRRVPPEQVVYASDFPYGQQPGVALHRAAHGASAPGSTRTQLRGMLAGNANRLADGDDAARADAAARAGDARPADAARADPPVPLDGDAASSGCARPTRSACSGSRSTPAPSATAQAETTDRIAELLEAARGALAVAAGPRRGPDAARTPTRLCRAADPHRRRRGGDRCLSCRVNGGALRARRAGRDLARRGAARRDRPHRHEDRLQRGALRRVHRARRRHADALLHHARPPGRRTRGDDDRGPARPPDGRRVRPRRRRPVRLLHARADRAARSRSSRARPEPSTEEIRHRMAGNLCRCGTYPKIEEAIRTWRD